MLLPTLRNGSSLPGAWGGPVNRLSTLFDQFFNDDPFFAPLAARTWPALPLSVWEDDNNIYVEADAPGLTEQDVELSVQDGNLLIQGERKCERKQGGFDTRSYGRFGQRVVLPAAVDADKVEARLANGVLSITLPKCEAAKPRRITLKSE
jgi:HSP20 family protein